MPVVLSVYGGCQLLRRLCCTAVHETCTSKCVCFGKSFFAQVLYSSRSNVYIFTNAIKTNSEVVDMFTYLQTLYNRAVAAADSIRTQIACLRVHQPSRATKKRNSTFCGAGVPDEHNDANPTHNVMNTHTHTHTHTHWQVLYSSRK